MKRINRTRTRKTIQIKGQVIGETHLYTVEFIESEQQNIDWQEANQCLISIPRIHGMMEIPPCWLVKINTDKAASISKIFPISVLTEMT